MSRSGLSLRSPLPVLPLIAVLALAPLASGAAVLEVYTDSLTTYLPSSASAVQDIRPMAAQRGVGLDGSLWAGSTFPLTLAANPQGSPWTGRQRMGDIRLDLGTYSVTEVDLAIPATVPWVIGRTYNHRQETSGASHRDSDGYQGTNWFQTSQPEIVLFEHATDDTKDVLYFVYGADRYIEFRRLDDGEDPPVAIDVYKAVNGATGMAVFTEGATDEPDVFSIYDGVGTRIDLFGFDGDAGNAAGQIWRIVGTGGDVAYVGDDTTGSTAIANGFDADGRILVAYDSEGVRFSYEHTMIEGVKRLTEVVAEVNSGGWTEIGRVEYTYYESTDTYGGYGDLELVRRHVPMSSGSDVVFKTHYRYGSGVLDRVLGPEQARRYDYVGAADSTLDEDFLTASDATLEDYWSLAMSHDGSYRVSAIWHGGAGCGCIGGGGGGGGSGSYALTYGAMPGYSPISGYDHAPATYTRIEEPGTLWELQEFDKTGQPLTHVTCTMEPLVGGATDETWITYVERWASSGNNPGGSVRYITSPSAHGAWNNTTGAFTTNLGAIATQELTPYTAGDTLDGQPKNFALALSGSPFADRDTTSTTASLEVVSGVHLYRPLVSGREDFLSNSTTLSYSYHSGAAALRPISATTTHPAVTSNGSASALTSVRYMRADGTPAFAKSTDGVWSYTRVEGGLVTERRVDPDMTGSFPSGDDPSGDFGISESSSGGELELVTSFAYDPQGRRTSTTGPSGRVSATHYTSLADGRLVTLSVPAVSGGTYYGPASYVVTNQAGKVEAQGAIAFSGGTTSTAMSGWIDSGDDDVEGAVLTGTLAWLTVMLYDETGTRLDEQRAFYDIAGSGYDATTFGYDEAGRRHRVMDPTGTITRTVFDEIGRPIEVHVGTNDSSFAGGSPSGTDNMVKVSATVYDGGDDNGDSLVTSRTLYVVDGTTDQRVTTYLYDTQKRRVVAANAESPHEVIRYDANGRVVARGLYSDSSGLTSSTNPLTNASNRIALSETLYDQWGRPYQSVRWEIDASDGSKGDSLTFDTWYGPGGQVAKQAGGELVKMEYDAAGRLVRRFTLADDNDASYAAAAVDGPDGDTVLLEQQTYYVDDEVQMQVWISRFHDDTSSTGPLDPDDDISLVDQTGSTYGSDRINGRVQITGFWSDAQGRRTDVVALGTFGDANYDRDSYATPHARSDTALRTTTTYADDGAIYRSEDPAGTITQFAHDDAGRVLSETRNYVDGIPGDDGGDDDQTIEYEYTNGLRTKYIAALPGGDQETVYAYGVTTSDSPGPSAFASNRLLRSVTYPDSAGGSDLVTYAYNCQGQQIFMKDQAGNVIETEYGDDGLESARRVTTLAGGVDGRVRAIRTSYNALGLRSGVKQSSDPSSTSSAYVIDEVGFEYNGWALLESRDQDFNSEIDAGGSVDHWRVGLAYAKDIGGRRVLRQSDQYVYYTDSTEKQHVVFDYASGIDDDASRVSAVQKYDGMSLVTLAEYDYAGVAHLVGTTYTEPAADVLSVAYGSTTGAYPGLDRFNRVVSCVWSKDVSGGPIDFFDWAIAYDRVSNVTLIEDNVYTGWDTQYAMDGLDRLVDATSGTWSGSAITSQTRREVWELDQAGNWDVSKLDLDGDDNFSDTGEFNVSGTFNDANEQTGRGGDTLTYDAAGNLTDNGDDQDYVWDAFNRLAAVKDQSGNLIAQYRYNGLGEMIGYQCDTDGDGVVRTTDDNDDRWELYLNDPWWRRVATVLGVDDGAGKEAGEYLADADDDPKELFVFHAAGLDGRGASSYIDAVILRDADLNGGGGGWGGASDGTLEFRAYYCQNQRADVVMTLDQTGAKIEGARYFAYGMPFGLPRSDCDGDGDVDIFDNGIKNAAYGKSVGQVGYDVRADIDLDGDVDATDSGILSGDFGQTLGRGNLSRDPTLSGGIGNRIGYAGYQWDPSASKLHVRHRALDTLLGRWNARDELGYVDGASVYEYVQSRAPAVTDPSGLRSPVMCVPYQQLTPEGEYQSGCSLAGAQLSGGGEIPPPLPNIPCAGPTDNIPGAKPAWNRTWKSCNGAMPTICCESSGCDAEGKCSDGRCSNYDPNTHKIVLCDQSSSGCGPLGDSLAHELIHAAQACEYGGGGDPWQPPPDASKWNNPIQTLCRELDAYLNEPNYAGCPGTVGSPQFRSCICDWACSSARTTRRARNLWPTQAACVSDCLSTWYDECSGGQF